jgi:hypothetical protein
VKASMALVDRRRGKVVSKPGLEVMTVTSPNQNDYDTLAATTARYAHLDADLYGSASEAIGGRIATAIGEAFEIKTALASEGDIESLAMALSAERK